MQTNFSSHGIPDKHFLYNSLYVNQAEYRTRTLCVLLRIDFTRLPAPRVSKAAKRCLRQDNQHAVVPLRLSSFLFFSAFSDNASAWPSFVPAVPVCLGLNSDGNTVWAGQAGVHFNSASSVMT